MTLDLAIPLLLFCLSGVITPGPNNMMLLASGANFGFRRSIPHMAGIALGVPIMCFPVGLGAMRLFEIWPVTETILTVVSALYMLWLAWKIANAAPPQAAQATGTPLTFLQAAAFQYVNPKAWSMSLGAITLYAPSRDLAAIFWVATAFALMGSISTTTWTTLGTGLQRLLTNQRRLRTFNWTMAALLVASLVAALLR